MKTFLFRLWQWTWGFPQTLLGAVIRFRNRKNPSRVYHGCIVTRWKNTASLGVGMYLFLSERSYDSEPQVQVHEFGHAVQSAILGPLFLPIMGIPSFLWCKLSFCRNLRRKRRFPTINSIQKAPPTGWEAWSAVKNVTWFNSV